MSGRGTPRRRVYLVRRVMAVVVLLLVFGLLVPQAYQALVNTPTGSETRSTGDAPSDNSREQADRTDREASPGAEQASGGTPARTERDEPAAEPSPQPDAPEDDSQDDDREGEQAQESEEPPAAESVTTETPAPADVSADAEDVETGNVESAPLQSAVPAAAEPIGAGSVGNWDEFSATNLPVVSTYDKVAARAAARTARKQNLRAERRVAARNARAEAPVPQPAFEIPAADDTAPAANRAAYPRYGAYQYDAAPARDTQRMTARGEAAQTPVRSATEPASRKQAGATGQQTATTTCWSHASSYSYAWSSQYGARSNHDHQYDHDSSQYGTGDDSAACGAEAYSGARSGVAGASAGAGAGSQRGSSYSWQYSN